VELFRRIFKNFAKVFQPYVPNEVTTNMNVLKHHNLFLIFFMAAHCHGNQLTIME
jgi:hypothetical protein